MKEQNTSNLSVGDIVGNTVVGFDWKIISKNGYMLKIQNTYTGETKTVNNVGDGYYKFRCW